MTSTSATQALTAAQGKVLKDTLDMTVSSSFGVGQTWQDRTSSRVSGTTYTNSTNRPLEVYIYTGTNGSTFQVDGATLPVHGSSMVQIVVLSGKTYSFNGSFEAWLELR